MSADASHRNLLSVFFAVWATLCFATELNPGVISRHSVEFLTLWHEKFLSGDFLKEKLNTTRIPDQEGNLPIFIWSSVAYNITDIVLNHYDKPKVEVSIKPYENITLNVEVSQIMLSCKHELELKTGNWTLHKVSGNLSMSIFGAKLTMSREVVISEENKEKVKYISHNCTAVIEDVYLQFYDSLSNDIGCRIYNEDLKKQIEDRLCIGCTYLTENEISFEHDRDHVIYLDMTLLTNPVIRNSSVEYCHRGELRHKTNTQPYNSWPDTISPQDSEEMVTSGISIWTLNTLCKVIHDEKMFNCNYTEDDLPDDRKHLLNTTCVDDCFGNFFLNISELHPNKKVEIVVSTSEKPLIEIGPNKFKIEFYLNMKIFVRMSEYSKEEIFSVNVNLSAKVLANIKQNNLVFELERPVDSSFTVLGSSIGHPPVDELETVLALVLQKNAMPLITKLKTEGVQLTSVSNFTTADVNRVITNDAVWFMINLEN